MELGLKNKVAMVGGASKGLGFAVARALAAEGAQVSIASRDAEAITRAAKLDGENLYWIEEPTTASDYDGHARIARDVTVVNALVVVGGGGQLDQERLGAARYAAGLQADVELEGDASDLSDAASR